jgi:hypothetical protein
VDGIGATLFAQDDPTYAERHLTRYDINLLHELGHRVLGLNDLYVLNPPPDEFILVTDRTGAKVQASTLPLVYPGVEGIMQGGNTYPHNKLSYWERHTAAGMNTDYLERRAPEGQGNTEVAVHTIGRPCRPPRRGSTGPLAGEDDDGDEVRDLCDNCPVANPAQSDLNHNGVGDACDCTGDCNLDGDVFGNEITVGVNVMAGRTPLTECLSADQNGDGEIFGNEITIGVANLGYGCFARGGDTLNHTATFEIWGAIGKRGDPITFPVVVTNGATQIGALNVDLEYPANVITTPICDKDPRLPIGHSFETADVTGVRKRIALVDRWTYPAPTVTDGVVATCQAQILASAPFGQHMVTLHRNGMGDAVGNVLPSSVTSGTIHVFDPDEPLVISCAIQPPQVASTIEVLLLGLLPVALWIRRRIDHWKRCQVYLLVITVGLALPALEAGAQPLVGAGGSWRVIEAAPETTRLAASDAQHTWHVCDVHRDGNVLSGRIALVGASFISIGRFYGHVSATGRFAGNITDSEGTRVATVHGEITTNGLVGEFAATNGDRGEWAWTAPSAAAWMALYEDLTQSPGQ